MTSEEIKNKEQRSHVPVLYQEVIESYSRLSHRSDLVFLDGTFGRGGHFEAIIKNYKIELALACDQDIEAINYGRPKFPQAQFFHMNFYEFARDNKQKLDLILLDLGVSSPQLDISERGFSFNKDGPLDMRMNQNGLLTAEKIVNEFSADDLQRIFKLYGEIERPDRVVKAIVQDRAEEPFLKTLQLSKMIERIEGWKKKGFHPATQYFMALRLAVNSELEVVEKAVPLFIEQLNEGGLFSIITFHSLEDRLVKNIFKESSLGYPVHKKVIVPTAEECKMNPRARSAKLRVFQKGRPEEKPDKFELRRLGLR